MVVIAAPDSRDARWDYLWLFDAGWHVLSFVILMAICALWRPQTNNQQYACMEELPGTVAPTASPCTVHVLRPSESRLGRRLALPAY